MIKLSRSIDPQASKIFTPVYYCSQAFSLLTYGHFTWLNFNLLSTDINNNGNAQTDILFQLIPHHRIFIGNYPQIFVTHSLCVSQVIRNNRLQFEPEPNAGQYKDIFWECIVCMFCICECQQALRVG